MTNTPAWNTEAATGVIVLADGTVIEEYSPHDIKWTKQASIEAKILSSILSDGSFRVFIDTSHNVDT